jgi:hypothetical protein
MTLRRTNLATKGNSPVTKLDKDTFREFVIETFDDMAKLLDRKNSDYTAGGSVFSNFELCEELGFDRLDGLAIRFLDKVQRLKSFVRNGKLQVADEGVEDVFKDFIGYSVIALAMLHEDKGE